jgi:YidC/Oxa1 family membrane protein insertase
MYKSPHAAAPDPKRLMLAMVLAAILVVFWQFTVEMPKRAKLAEWQRAQQLQQVQAEKRKEAQAVAGTEPQFVTREDAIKTSPRLRIASPKLHGSIALKGLRFDDVTLVKYHTELDENSPEVVLLTPAAGENLPYFVQVGWTSEQAGITLPNKDSIWKSDVATLTPETPATLSWKSPEGVVFEVNLRMDSNYMFAIEQRVINHSSLAVAVTPYALINRGYTEPKIHAYISHEGPVGVLEGVLKEVDYQELRDDGDVKTPNAKGWLGFTDKYWLTALIPASTFDANISTYKTGETDRYQVDIAAEKQLVATGETARLTQHLFVGAKELDVLDTYADHGNKELGLAPTPLFDRAVDFGWLYFITKPIFLMLNFFYAWIGNFGVAILLLTLCIKLAMFPLANKGYKAATQMRRLQPEMVKLKEQCGDDKLKLQQEMLALYRREKVNPASGCLPMLIQLPVFFALYKVLFVTLEMRHAPFFSVWQDLSAADPTNIFTAFGLIAWTPPSFLHLGILPILMSLTMIIQMKQQPQPTDPAQAMVLKLMPYFLLIIMAQMPAGLLIYWVFSNILSIAQQAYISKKVGVKVESMYDYN